VLDTSMYALTSRQAYRALCAHYQGRQTHSSLADAAMSTLSSTNFDGRKGGLTLESYCHKMRKAVNDLNEFGGSDARLGPRVAIKFFLDAISDKDLSTAITVIRNDVTVTTLDDAITSVQAQHISVLATAACRISSLMGGGGGSGGGEAETLVATRT